jgi:hypothetical protein
MLTKVVLAGLIAATAACTRVDASDTAQPSHARIRSTSGFSFLPPPGKDWTEAFEQNQIGYSKKTDPAIVTFYAGALEIKLPDALPDAQALAAFVKTKKENWGSDGRYTEIASSFLPEAQQPSCVRYRMAAHDHGAKNRGSPPYLQLLAVGRFCTHPQNPHAAVDIYYSTRHIPRYDASEFNAEGEAFLGSLALDTVSDQSVPAGQ